MPEQKKILIVEDEQAIRQALRKSLSATEGIAIYEAENGEKALEMIATSAPDLILLDVIMPKMHGIDMLKTLRTGQQHRDIPVILLTNYADDPKVIEAVKNGLCELMDKTKCRLDDVVVRIKQKLGVA
ncbi:MAG: response regulator [Patescibacteria group bacterium]